MNHEDLDAEFERIVSGWDIDAEEPTPRAAATRPETDPTAPPSDFPSEGATASQTDTPADGATDTAADHGADHGPEHATGSPPDGPPGAVPPPVGSKAPSVNPPPVFRGGLTLPVAPTTSHVWRGSSAADTPPAGTDEPLPDDDHFVPEDPDLPSAEDDPMFWAIVVGLVGGPLLLLYVLVFDRDGSPWWIVTGLTMIVVGFVMLVLRGSDDRDPFDDGSRV